MQLLFLPHLLFSLHALALNMNTYTISHVKTAYYAWQR